MVKKVKTTAKPPIEYPKAAPGSGAILYRKGPKPNTLWVGSASRSDRVGRGHGISFGGFGRVIKVLMKALGGVITMESEAFREGNEELPGLRAIISFLEFMLRRVYLTSFMVHTDDVNKVHCAIYFGCPITAAEQEKISALRPSRETTRPLDFFLLSWRKGDPGRITLELPLPLKHKHEKRAFRALAALADAGKLPFME